MAGLGTLCSTSMSLRNDVAPMIADVWLPIAATSSSQGIAPPMRCETMNTAVPSDLTLGGRNRTSNDRMNTTNTTDEMTWATRMVVDALLCTETYSDVSRRLEALDDGEQSDHLADAVGVDGR